MHKASSVTHPKDGPKTALHKMRDVGLSSILVVDTGRRLLGIVTADECSRLAKEGKTSLEEIIGEVATVHADDMLSDLFAEEHYPVAVVDDEKRLQGIVIRGALLAALSERRSD